MVDGRVVRVGLLLGLLSGVACDDPALSGTEALLTVTPEAVDFGTAYVGRASEREVRLASRGSGPITARLTVDGDAAFTVDRATVTIGPAQAARVHVRIAADADGVHSGTLVIESNALDHPRVEVALTAEVLPIPACDDALPCTDDRFDVDLEQCVHAARTGACDDGNACTREDRCHDGACVGEAVRCEDDVGCTIDACDPEVGCVFLPDHAACDDGEPCTWDRCDPERGCTRTDSPDGTPCGPSEQCKTANVCWWGTCREVGIPNGTPCEDGDPCTGGDTCTDGECLGERTQGDPELVQWLPSYGEWWWWDGAALPLSDGHILWQDPGVSLTVLEVINGVARPVSNKVLQDVDLIAAWAEGVPGRVIAVTYSAEGSPPSGRADVLILQVSAGGAVWEVARVPLGPVGSYEELSLESAPGLAYVENRSRAWIVDWQVPEAPVVVETARRAYVVVDAPRRRLLVQVRRGLPVTVVPLDGTEPFESSWIPPAQGIEAAGDLLLTREDETLTLWSLLDHTPLAILRSATAEGRAWRDALLVGDDAMVTLQSPGDTYGDSLLQWWDLADPSHPVMVVARGHGGALPRMSRSGLAIEAGPTAWQVDEGSILAVEFEDAGPIQDLVPFMDGLLSLSGAQARVYTFEDGLPRQDRVLDAPAAGLVLLPPGTSGRLHLPRLDLPPWRRTMIRHASDLRQLEAPRGLYLDEALQGHLLAGRRLLYRLTTQASEDSPDMDTLRVETFDPAALHEDSGTLVASPEQLWETVIVPGVELTASVDAEERVLAVAVSRWDGGPRVQVHQLHSGELLGSLDLCDRSATTGFSSGESVGAAALENLSMPLPALEPMACEEDSPFRWALPILAFEQERLLVVQARYRSGDMFEIWDLQGLRVFDLTPAGLVEGGSWALPTVADLLVFDGRRAWLALGEHAGIDSWYLGHGRVLILDTSDPAAAPTVVDLPQTPTSLVFRDGRMHLGSITGLSTVAPACPAP